VSLSSLVNLLVALVLALASLFGEPHHPPELSHPAAPPVTAAALFAVDVSAGVPLYARNADVRRAPASLAKMATALVVVAHARLDTRVTIAPSDVVNPRVYSHMGLVAGDTLTVEQLLYGLLLPSGDDAAHALARSVGATLPGGDPARCGDPIAAFVRAMNGLVASLGLRNTHFVNPAGVDAPGQYASARDLATLAAALLQNPALAIVVQTPRVELTSVGPEQRIYVLTNTNQFAGQPGTLGVKTGTTPAAGGCLVVAARFHRTNTVIVVLLGSRVVTDASGAAVTDKRYDDANAIFAALARDYRWRNLAVPGEIPGLAAALAARRMVVRPGPSLVIAAADFPRLRFTVERGWPAPPDGRVGQVRFFVGAIPIAARPLYPDWQILNWSGA